MAAARETRVVGSASMAGLIAVPVVLRSLLLGAVYVAGLRKATFGYAFGPAAIALVVRLAVAAARSAA